MRQTTIATLLLSFATLVAAAPAAPPPAAAASMPALPDHAAMPERARHRPQVFDHYVDINSASRTELMTLPGIGPAEADRIVAHRPYLTKTELVTKEVLATGPYLTLRTRIVAMQKFKPLRKG